MQKESKQGSAHEGNFHFNLDPRHRLIIQTETADPEQKPVFQYLEGLFQAITIGWGINKQEYKQNNLG